MKSKWFFNLGVLSILLLFLVGVVSCTGATQSVMNAPMNNHGQHMPTDAMSANHMTGGQSSNLPLIADAREIIIVAKEFSFEPAQISLAEGEAVNITLVNEGQLPHELVIADYNFHIHAEGGATAKGGLIAGEDGTYEVGCFIAGHYESGMAGTLTIVQ